jgi:hypothetical protein
MTRARLGPPDQAAVRQFVDAVLALSDNPGPANLQRYLAVSQELEESRRSLHASIETRTHNEQWT